MGGVMAESLQVLEDADKKLFSSSTKERVSLFEGGISAAFSSSDPDAAVVITSLIFQTLPLYDDRKSESVVERTILTGLKKNTQFLKAFTAPLVQKSSRLSKSDSLAVKHKLLRWSILLLKNCPNVLQSKAATSRIISIQSVLLTSVLADGHSRLKTRTMHSFFYFFSQNPAAFPMYISEVKSMSLSFENIGIMEVILKFFSDGELSVESRNEHKAFFIELYLKLVLSSREPIPEYASRAFSPLIKLISQEEFSTSIAPVALKMLKRNPELTLNATRFLISGVKIDLSKYLEEFLPTVLNQIRVNEEWKRKEALRVLKELICKCSNIDTVASSLDTMKKVLAGSEGKISSAAQRSDMAFAIQTFATGSHGPDVPPIASSISLNLMNAYKDELSDEVKVSMLSAVGEWLALAESSIPAITTSFYQAVLKDKETLRRAGFRSLRIGFKNPKIRNEILPLVDSLFALLKSGMSKASQRIEGVYCLLLSASIAAVDLKTDERLSKEKIWSSVVTKDSSILSHSVVPKLTMEEDLLALSNLVEIALLQHPSRINPSSDGAKEIHQLAVSLLWNPSLKVRKCVQDSVKRCHMISADLSMAFIAAFAAWMPVLEERQAAMKQSETSVELPVQSEASAASVPHPNLLSQALVYSIAADAVDSALVCVKVMLLAHHPLLVTGRNRGVVWKAVSKTLRKRGLDTASVLASDASAVCAVLLGPEGLLNPRTAQSQAAMDAVSTAMKTFPNEFFPELLEGLKKIGDRSQHDEITESDYKIFVTPEGQLASDKGAYVAEVVRDRNVRQARGRMKMYDDDLGDDEGPVTVSERAPAPALRPSQVRATAAVTKKDPVKKEGSRKDPAKPGKKADGDKSRSAKDDARDAQLREEANRRREILVIKERLALVLKTLGMAAVANPSFAHDQLPALEGLVLPLLSSRILAREAFEAMSKLASCLAPSIQHIAADVAKAVCAIATSASGVTQQLRIVAGSENVPDSANLSGVERVLNGLVAACRQGPLPAASFWAVFPIVETVLMSAHKTRAHDDLIDLMALHTSPFIKVPRDQMLAVLYHVLGVVPVYSEKVSPLLRDLCEGLTPAELPQALSGLFSPQPHVRSACLEAVKHYPNLAVGAVPKSPGISATLWMAQYDPSTENLEAAELVWDMYRHEMTAECMPVLTSFLKHSSWNVRVAAAQGLAAAMDEYPKTVPETLSSLFGLYVENVPKASEWDGDTSAWEAREGVALALQAAADVITTRDLPLVITFLISKALADPSGQVRAAMVDAGAAIVQRHGKDNVGLLLPIFENFLERKSADESRYDLVREGVVVFFGALAQHFAQDAERVDAIIGKLVDVLNTPSESVQRKVSECLVPLMRSKKDSAQALVQRLLHTLTDSDSYGERRGAAFGLAGVVKGLGLRALKQHNVLEALKRGMENKNMAKAREGSLFGIQGLSEKLGRLFEPYAIHVIPWLLVCYSDGVMAVREATEMAAKTIMGQLTGPGVKLVLPALLQGLNDRQWRTKQGSVQLLGAMAFCAPEQLSHCLPTIVPQLSLVLTDTHSKVQSAAKTALQQVGSVIRNPEISALVPTLLIGIKDPNEHTKSSLDVLLQTTFVNSVDAASLALLIPIVHRGLRERSSEIKKKAAQITGNMCTLATDHRDMLPYLHLMMPELKKVLVDPHPEVRSVAAKSFGSLYKGLGESHFEDIIPWLLETLKSNSSSVERSGAAQGLSEVISALGKEKLESLLPDIIQNCSDSSASVRDGHLTLLKYLPVSFGARFQKYLPKVLPAILDGLADENEQVRDVALATGRVFVDHYATTSLPLLLPAVEEGIFSDSWRIRQSSVELLGDLLFKVAGTSGKVVIDGGSDDEGASTEAQGRAIIEVLGLEKRNQVLAEVYIVRSDITLPVRQAALHVWKTVVANTPKTLKEILGVLMRTVIGSLASTSSERRQMAGRALGELVRKLGERILPDVIPILSRGLEDANSATRQGVCFGLSEVMLSTGRQQLAEFMPSLIQTIKTALCDNEPEVRESAGQAFNTLYKNAGMQAIDEIVPSLLLALEDKDKSDTALDGLRQILSVRTAAVLPHILPRLVQPPLTPFNAHALGALAEVAGSSLNSHLSTVMPPLVNAIGSSEEMAEITKPAAFAVIMAVDEDGVDSLLSELYDGLQDALPATRKGAADLLTFLCKNSKMDLEEEIPTMLTTLILMLTDTDPSVVKASWTAISAVTGMVPKESLPLYLKTVRDALASAKEKERRRNRGVVPDALPGLAIPKALQPFLPVFLQGLMSGSAELREQSAEGLAELITLTSDTSLKPFVVQITGPLIRIIGDRFPSQVKSAILGTLYILILKGGLSLKPFVPQLQTTFLKCLQDSSRHVRAKAAKSLGRLSTLNPRVDSLLNDLLNGIQTAEPAVKESMAAAMRGVLKFSGKNASAVLILRSMAVQKSLVSADNDSVRSSAAKTVGILSEFVEVSEVEELLDYARDLSQSDTWTSRHGAQQCLSSLARHSAAKLIGCAGGLPLVLSCLKTGLSDDQVAVREVLPKTASRVLAQLLSGSEQALVQEFLSVLSSLLSDDASAVRRAALEATKSLAKAVSGGAGTALLASLGGKIAECLKDLNQPVRLAAERTSLHVFQLTKGQENVAMAQKYITGLDARRIAKMAEQSDGSEDSEGEGMD